MKNIMEIVKFICCFVLIIMFILAMPNMILIAQYFLQCIPYLGAIYEIDLLDSEYIEVSISLIVLCTTSIMGLITYKLTKTLGKIELVNQKEKMYFYSRDLIININKNCKNIRLYEEDIRRLLEVKVDEEIEEKIIYLSFFNFISTESKNILMNYYKQINTIQTTCESCKTDDDEKLKRLVTKFISDFLDDEDDEEKFKSEMKKSVEELRRVKDGRDNNV